MDARPEASWAKRDTEREREGGKQARWREGKGAAALPKEGEKRERNGMGKWCVLCRGHRPRCCFCQSPLCKHFKVDCIEGTSPPNVFFWGGGGMGHCFYPVTLPFSQIAFRIHSTALLSAFLNCLMGPMHLCGIHRKWQLRILRFPSPTHAFCVTS